MSTDFSKLSLFIADNEQIGVHIQRAFEQWGRGLSLEEFVKKDKAFHGLQHATDGKHTVWILALRENGHSTLDFFCSCETYQREVALSEGVLQSCNRKVPLGYGIASVITPPKNRSRGYAKHMMRLLHYVLADPTLSQTFPSFPTDQWGTPPAIPEGFGKGIVSVLHSDVGEKFYRACGIGFGAGDGWTVRGPIGTIWKVPKQQVILMNSGLGNIRWLTKEDQEGVWDEDALLIQKEIGEATTPCFSFLPNNGVAESPQAWGLFYSPTESEGDIWGARIEEQGDRSNLAFATWCLDPGREGPGTMLITRLRVTSEQFPILLDAAFEVARRFGLEQVEIWNLERSLVDIGRQLGGETSEREDCLSSFAWYGSGNKEEIKWRYNEKFCW
ncbi:hypothetical protein FRC14_004823 [Serendipita sp. 396]|nr:hypothetical protein FRC14_004823 [Serendipita sp. 396]